MLFEPQWPASLVEWSSTGLLILHYKHQGHEKVAALRSAISCGLTYQIHGEICRQYQATLRLS